MKKILTCLMVLLFTFALVGCGDDDDNGGGNGGNEDNRIVLTYAAWNLGTTDSASTNMERLMLDAFMAKYPNIKVEVIERPKVPGTNDDMGWTEFLAARASVGTLPDVFMADDIPSYVVNDWAYNLTSIANADSEYLNISTDITGAATYNNKVMSLPQAVHYMGYVVNETLYDNRNQDIPDCDTTMEQLLAWTKAAANHASTNGQGIVGFEGIEHIIHWYAAQLNSDYQWFTFDGTEFNLDSSEFAETMALYRNLATDSSFVLEALQTETNREDYTGTALADIFPEGDNFNNGNILCKWYYSYDFGWMQTKINSGEYTWDLDFIGTPVVDGVKRVPIVIDFLTVASTTEHPEEAYLLAKWMGFGKDGYQKRIDISNNVSGVSQVNFAPIQDDTTLLDAYFDIYSSFTGLRTIIEEGTFVVEPPKYLPGYIDARYNGSYDPDNKMYDIINKLFAGDVVIADIATALNERANALYQAASSEFYSALALR